MFVAGMYVRYTHSRRPLSIPEKNEAPSFSLESEWSVTSNGKMTAVDVAILSFASFCGIVGISLTGFGMAIIYIFVWQIFNLFGKF